MHTVGQEGLTWLKGTFSSLHNVPKHGVQVQYTSQHVGTSQFSGVQNTLMFSEFIDRQQ